MSYKPEDRRIDSLSLLNKIHEEVAAELSKDDLLVRKEWFCVRAFFTCMKNAVDYDPHEDARLSLQAYRAIANFRPCVLFRDSAVSHERRAKKNRLEKLN